MLTAPLGRTQVTVPDEPVQLGGPRFCWPSGLGLAHKYGLSHLGVTACTCAAVQTATVVDFQVVAHYTTLHYTTLHYTTLHYTTLHYTTLHYTTLHYTTLHYTTLHLVLRCCF
jgi:hypothetical protein